MFDAHTHLNSDQLYPHWQSHIQDFIAVGGTHLVNIGIDTIYNARNIVICEERVSSAHATSCTVNCSVGIHPCSVGSNEHTTREQISSQLGVVQGLIETYREYIVAVGECGIDAHWGDYDALRDLQTRTLQEQCTLARQYDLPVVIHSRSQRSDTISVLQDYTDLKIYLHCRGYTSDEIRQACEILPHLWIGFAGNTTYPKAESLRDSLHTAWRLQQSGKCHIVIETDAPYLTPQAHRGKTNTPAYLADHSRLLADYLSISTDSLIQTTASNSMKLYGL